MLEGLYSAASGMEAQQAQFDAVSNDMANVDTPGYQSTIIGFHDLLYSNGNYGSNVPTGAGAEAEQMGRDQTQGAIQQTGQPLDVAVEGQGFIEVRRPDGTIGLTRNGSLQLNNKRQLTTQTGMLDPAADHDSGGRRPEPGVDRVERHRVGRQADAREALARRRSRARRPRGRRRQRLLRDRRQRRDPEPRRAPPSSRARSRARTSTWAPR